MHAIFAYRMLPGILGQNSGSDGQVSSAEGRSQQAAAAATEGTPTGTIFSSPTFTLPFYNPTLLK